MTPPITNPVIEAMETCRAMRFLRPDPIPDDVLRTVLYAATRASNPNNTQAWTFVVVRDGEQRRALGDAVASLAARLDPDAVADPTDRRTLIGAVNLTRTMADAPVIVVVCVRNVYPPQQPRETMMWSAGYAASQNLIVAARSLGLGSVFTTLHQVNEPAVRRALDIPDDVAIATMIPLGWPGQPFGPVTRRPLDDVIRFDRFG